MQGEAHACPNQNPAKYETRIGKRGSKPSDMQKLMMALGYISPEVKLYLPADEVCLSLTDPWNLEPNGEICGSSTRKRGGQVVLGPWQMLSFEKYIIA